ncbi:MAG: hypothetical protein ACP5FH_01435 [Terracidiphilus sp.]
MAQESAARWKALPFPSGFVEVPKDPKHEDHGKADREYQKPVAKEESHESCFCAFPGGSRMKPGEGVLLSEDGRNGKNGIVNA